MEHNSENEEVVQQKSGVIKTHKPLFAKPRLIGDVTEGIQPIFSDSYFRYLHFLDDPQDFTRPQYVTKEEAERMAAPITECPMCDAGIPFVK